MKLNIYTYKGPFNSLLGPWATVGYITPKIINLDAEAIVPKHPYLFSQRSDLSKFNDLLTSESIIIKTSPSSSINDIGELNLFYNAKKIIAGAKSLLNEDEQLFINYIDKPISWDERLCVIYSVFIRHYYLQSRSTNINYLNLDYNINAHLDVIKNYKYLPPYYLTINCLKMFINVWPKPSWYLKEIDFIINNT